MMPFSDWCALALVLVIAAIGIWPGPVVRAVASVVGVVS